MHIRARTRFRLLAMLMILPLALSNLFTFGSAAFAGGTTGTRQIDVWDFGGVQVPSTDPLYSLTTNHIAAQDLDALTSDLVDPSTKKLTGSPIAFGDLTIYPASGDRLYYDEADGTPGVNNYGSWGNATHTYEDSYTSNGTYYANGTGGDTRRYLTIANVEAGDKISVYGSLSAYGPEVIHFLYQGTGGTQDDQQAFSTTPARYDFVAKDSGTYKIYISASAGGKPYFHRVVRTPGVKVSGMVNVNNNTLPAGYSLNFTNQTTNDTTVVPVNADNTFNAVLAPGYSYVATLKDINQYTISDATKVIQVNPSDIPTGLGSINLDVVANKLATVSGKLVGFAGGYDLSHLQIRLIPPAGSLAATVTANVYPSSMTYSATVQQGVSYTADMLGADDYSIVSGGTVSITSDASQDITVKPKPVYPATGSFVGLPQTAQVQSITFTNVEDGYTYKGTVTGGGYSVNLRDGAYSVSAVVDGYSTTSHVVVNGAAVTKDLLFEPVDATVQPLPWTSDLYVGDSSKANNFATVKEALAAAARMNPTDEAHRITIHIAPGVYRAQLIINTPYITLVNTDPSKEVKLTWYYGVGYEYYSAGSDGWYNEASAFDKYDKHTVSKWGASVYVTSAAKGFQADNITFENSFNKYITSEELADGVQLAHEAGSTITVERTANLDVTSRAAQERAAAIAIEADEAEFDNCSFIGGQDTLYTGPGGTHLYFKNSYIEGNTDFIFGDGDAVFDHSTLDLSGYSDASQAGYITAAKDLATYGYLFLDSTIEASRDNQAASFFGRPWGAKAHVTFENTKLKRSDLIDPAGWTSMSGNLPQNANFAEYNTTYNGTPVDTSKRVVPALTNPSSIPDVTAYFGSGWTPSYYGSSAPAAAAQSAITGEDIGPVGTAGSTTYNQAANEFTVTGAGALASGSSATDLDALQFAGLSSKVSGDSTIIAKVSSLNIGGASHPLIGLQVRTSLDANSNDAAVLIKPTASSDGSAASYTPYYLYRDAALGKNTISGTASPVTTAPDGSFYLKLAYQGSKVAPGDTSTSAYYKSYIGVPDSSGNIQWTPAKTTGTKSTVTNAYYIGMFVISNDPSQLVTVNFDNVTIEHSYDTSSSTPISELDGRMAPNWGGQGKVTPAVASNGDVTLTWNPAYDNFGVAKYNIYQGSHLVAGTKDGTTTAFTVTKAMVSGIDPTYDPTAKAYEFSVQAVDAAGQVSTDGPSTSSDILPPTWTNGTLSTTKVTQNTIDLTWSGASDSTGVAGYKLYDITNPAAPTLIAKLDGTTTSYAVTFLDSSTAYAFKVEAGDSSGNWSTDGPSLSVSTTAPVPDDEAPTWTDGKVSVSNLTQTKLTLTWSRADDNIGVKYYYIYEGTSTTPIAAVDARLYTYDIAGLAPATGYTFTIQAVDEAKNISTDGPSVTVTTLAGPSWTSPALSASNEISVQPNAADPMVKAVRKDSVTLTWSGATDPIGVTGYEILQDGMTNPVATVDADTASYTVVGLAPGAAYTFRVQALDGDGVKSTDGPSVHVVMPAPDTRLLPPRHVFVPPLAYDDTSVTLVWAKPDNYAEAGIADYNVYMDGRKIGSANGNSASPAKSFVDDFYKDPANSSAVRISRHTYTVTGLKPNTSHIFWVTSVDGKGHESAKSKPVIVRTTPAPHVFDVTQYGAQGDGKTLDTKAIQAALDAAPSGSKILIPAGKTFISGSLWIRKSNLTLEVDGTLKASGHAADFPYPDPTHQSVTKSDSLINTDPGLANIRITGTGTIDGNGWKQGAPGADGLPISLKSSSGTVAENGLLAAAQYNQALSWGFSKSEAYSTRSNLISVSGDNNVYFGGGLSIVNPSMHTLSIGSTNVTVNGVKILTYDCNNGDGIDMSGSGLTVVNSVFDTGDDDIDFGSGVGAAAEKNPPAGDAWIFDNYFRHGHGAVVAGSHTAAWIQNILFEDNVMNGIGVGLRAKTGAGVGGGARNFAFRDSAMKDVSDGDRYPFEFTSAYPSSTSDPAPDTGRFEHIFVSDVSVDGSVKNAIFVSGTPDAPDADIHFAKVSFNNTPPTKINYLKNSSFLNVTFTNVVKNAAPWEISNGADNLILNDTEAPTWTSGKVTASHVAHKSLSLAWSGAGDNTGVTAYRVYDGSRLVATVTSTGYVVTELKPEHSYTFTVQAGDAAGNWSTDGPSLTVKTDKTPPGQWEGDRGHPDP